MGSDSKPTRFFIDPTLLRLGKWLRYLGLDAPFVKSGMEIQNDGVLLTRRRDLEESGQVVQVPSDRLEEQLSWFVKRFPHAIEPDKVGSRCIRCNQILVEIPRDDAKDRVPDYIYQTHTSFKICPACRKIYWKGSHPERMQVFLKGIGIQVGGIV
ncbi:MAG: hypothetical protein DSY91_06280 [Deltaproteobacteria bacterium]|nr:MAG: hypothetical protein DSY91_06280 [Deltaproteobacteria bacterium]